MIKKEYMCQLSTTNYNDINCLLHQLLAQFAIFMMNRDDLELRLQEK